MCVIEKNSVGPGIFVLRVDELTDQTEATLTSHEIPLSLVRYAGALAVPEVLTTFAVPVTSARLLVEYLISAINKREGSEP